MYQRLFRTPRFNLFFSSRMISKSGTSLSGIAFLLLVYNLTHSGVQTTGIALTETIPYLLFGLIGGVTADRLPKKLTLVTLDALQGTLLICTALTYSIGQLSYPAILVVTFLSETAGCFYNPTSRAALPLLVRAADMSAANSLVDISSRTTQLLGPAAAYLFLHWIGYASFFTADGVSYVISAIILMFVSVPQPDAAPQLPHARHQQTLILNLYHSISEFARFAWKTRDLRNLLLATTAVVFFNTWVWQIGLLLRAESLFQNGQQMYSVFLICFSVFSILISLLLPLRMKNLRLRQYMLGAGLWGIGIIGIGVGPSGLTIAGFSVLIGIGMPIASLSKVFMLQSQVPQGMRGRAFSFSAVSLYLANTLSLVVFAAVSKFISLNHLFDIAGVGIILIPIGFAVLMKLSPLARGHAI